MKTVIATLASILAPALSLFGAPEGGRHFEHSGLDRVLAAYVNDQGLVDYAGLKRGSGDLEAYVELLEVASPKSHPGQFPTRAHELAYWINAYNAFVLKGVVDAYPVRSVKEIKLLFGFFKRTDFTAGGARYTLDDIEHEILRKAFDEPRIHVAISCASMGCPPLEQRAYHPEDVEARLEEAMKLFIRERRNVRILREEKKVVLSKIFDWFEADFTGWYKKTLGKKEGTIVDYLNLYLPLEDRDFLRAHPDVSVEYDAYDWTLNDQAMP